MSNNNNRMIVFASILGAILATSILALNPSIIANAQAQMYDNQYGYDNNDYYQDENQYGYDDNSYYNQDYNKYGYNDDSRVELEFADKYADDKNYKKHPSKDHKFVCKTGQFEGFFVKSPDVCDLEIPEGPQGPPGITFLNGTNLYRVNSTTSTSTSAAGATATATCVEENDFAISGGVLVLNNFANINNIFRSEPTATGNGWIVTLNGGMAQPITFQAVAICFDNPPPNP